MYIIHAISRLQNCKHVVCSFFVITLNNLISKLNTDYDILNTYIYLKYILYKLRIYISA